MAVPKKKKYVNPRQLRASQPFVNYQPSQNLLNTKGLQANKLKSDYGQNTALAAKNLHLRCISSNLSASRFWGTVNALCFDKTANTLIDFIKVPQLSAGKYSQVVSWVEMSIQPYDALQALDHFLLDNQSKPEQFGVSQQLNPFPDTSTLHRVQNHLDAQMAAPVMDTEPSLHANVFHSFDFQANYVEPQSVKTTTTVKFAFPSSFLTSENFVKVFTNPSLLPQSIDKGDKVDLDESESSESSVNTRQQLLLWNGEYRLKKPRELSSQRRMLNYTVLTTKEVKQARPAILAAMDFDFLPFSEVMDYYHPPVSQNLEDLTVPASHIYHSAVLRAGLINCLAAIWQERMNLKESKAENAALLLFWSAVSPQWIDRILRFKPRWFSSSVKAFIQEIVFRECIHFLTPVCANLKRFDIYPLNTSYLLTHKSLDWFVLGKLKANFIFDIIQLKSHIKAKLPQISVALKTLITGGVKRRRLVRINPGVQGLIHPSAGGVYINTLMSHRLSKVLQMLAWDAQCLISNPRCHFKLLPAQFIITSPHKDYINALAFCRANSRLFYWPSNLLPLLPSENFVAGDSALPSNHLFDAGEQALKPSKNYTAYTASWKYNLPDTHTVDELIVTLSLTKSATLPNSAAEDEAVWEAFYNLDEASFINMCIWGSWLAKQGFKPLLTTKLFNPNRINLDQMYISLSNPRESLNHFDQDYTDDAVVIFGENCFTNLKDNGNKPSYTLIRKNTLEVVNNIFKEAALLGWQQAINSRPILSSKFFETSTLLLILGLFQPAGAPLKLQLSTPYATSWLRTGVFYTSNISRSAATYRWLTRHSVLRLCKRRASKAWLLKRRVKLIPRLPFLTNNKLKSRIT